MITKRDILKMVRAIYRHDRGLPPRRIIHPAREWGIGIVAAALLLVSVCVAGAYVYVTLNTIEDRVAAPAVTTVRYDTATADRARDYFQQRQLSYQKLVADSPVVVPTATTTTRNDAPATTTTETTFDETTPVMAQ